VTARSFPIPTGTWTNIATPGKGAALKALNAAPFYTVAKVAGIAWLATVLRLDAIISPSGTGLIYLTSASRISFGLSKNGYIPDAFEKNSPKTKVPVIGIIITAIIGLLFLLPFPSWGKLVGVVTSASVLMYAGAPLALGALRLQKPDLPRAYRLPFGEVLAPLAFIFANFIVYWSGWGTYSTLMVVMLLGFALMLISGLFHLNPNQPKIDWGAAYWVFPYLLGMGIISYVGGFPGNGGSGIIGGVGSLKKVWVGGNGDLPLYYDLLVLTVFSLGIYYLAMRYRLSAEKVDEYVRDVYPPPAGE
jgi:amino acid transporter